MADRYFWVWLPDPNEPTGVCSPDPAVQYEGAEHMWVAGDGQPWQAKDFAFIEEILEKPPERRLRSKAQATRGRKA